MCFRILLILLWLLPYINMPWTFHVILFSFCLSLQFLHLLSRSFSFVFFIYFLRSTLLSFLICCSHFPFQGQSLSDFFVSLFLSGWSNFNGIWAQICLNGQLWRTWVLPIYVKAAHLEPAPRSFTTHNKFSLYLNSKQEDQLHEKHDFTLHWFSPNIIMYVVCAMQHY